MDQEIYNDIIHFFNDDFYLNKLEDTLKRVAENIHKDENRYDTKKVERLFSHCSNFVIEKRKENLDYFMNEFKEIKNN